MTARVLTRSEVMARVKGKNTTPELRVRKLFRAHGLHYRLHARELPGRPDIVFRARKVAIFVHGCFWHRHENCAAARLPKTRVDFWLIKLNGNVKRDVRNLRAIRSLGWSVFVIWECDTKLPDKLLKITRRIVKRVGARIPNQVAARKKKKG